MKKHKYINDYPTRQASDKITEGCIVLEGGAFRGTYTEGVLDALMDNDLNFQCTLGVSAGAMNGANYVSGQIGRSMRLTMNYRHDSRYMGLDAIKRDKGIFGFGFIFSELMDIEYFDRDRFMNSPMRFVAAATNCETGKTDFFEKNGDVDIYEAIKASSSLPLVSQPIKLNNTEYFDGGCSSRVPYDWAINEGYKKIIVVRTRHRDYRKDLSKRGTLKFVKMKYNKYPNFIKSLSDSNRVYNEQCDKMAELHDRGEIFMLSPSEPVNIGRFEGNLDTLKKLYELGYNDAKNNLDAINKYLESK